MTTASHPSAHRPAPPPPPRWLAAAGKVEVERVQLDDRSWVDVVRGLVPAHQRVHDELVATARWKRGQQFRYERWVEDSRPSTTQSGRWRHPALAEVDVWLQRRYRVRFGGTIITQYATQRDALGFHRDTGMTWVDDTIVAVLSLGAHRPWYLRPDTGRPNQVADDDDLRDVIDISPAGGDLLVMGGRCQRDWLHAVPPTSVPVPSRISAQWRWTSKRGEPDTTLRHRDAWRFTR